MLRIVRPSLIASVCLAAGAAVVSLGVDLVPRRELEDNAASSVRSPGDDSSPTDEELEARRRLLDRRTAIKSRVVRDLLAGRLTLLQAAARFRDLEETSPLTWGPRTTTSGPGEGERFCRSVMTLANAWVEVNLPSLAAEVAARLEAELEQNREADGTIRLPR